MQLLVGDCRIVMRELDDSSIDAVITDPPYELAFMGKGWDQSGVANDVSVWRECLRVLKPGGHLLAFGGTRTYHRMACAVEDAGFDIRDMVAWLYGSGMPKSHNLKGPWSGWGTALKPAHEPIVLARKPLKGTVANNVLRFGTGALNIDKCRIGIAKNVPASVSKRRQSTCYGEFSASEQQGVGGHDPNLGRWPANVIHDGSEEVEAEFAKYGDRKAGGGVKGTEPSRVGGEGTVCYGKYGRVPFSPHADSGTASRFFYCAKASKKDRDEGLDGPEQDVVFWQTANGTSGRPSSLSEGRNTKRKNTHPTVKPTELMRYLCRLVTPPGGIILDPFAGSGSTGKAAALEGFRFIGIELDESYASIAQARISYALDQYKMSVVGSEHGE